MKPTLTIRKAEPSDLPALVALRQEIVEWLASKGLDQWQPGSPRKYSADGVARSVERGDVWVAYDGDRLAGTITIDDYADPEFWTEKEQAQPALYLHRMMVARRYASSGAGGELLQTAEREAKRCGVDCIRLDAWKDNERLHRYYEAHGFVLLRVVDHPHRGSGALFAQQHKPS